MKEHPIQCQNCLHCRSKGGKCWCRLDEWPGWATVEEIDLDSVDMVVKWYGCLDFVDMGSPECPDDLAGPRWRGE